MAPFAPYSAPVDGAGRAQWAPWRVRGHEPLYAAARPILAALVAVLFRLRVRGRVPRDGAVIVAANHVSFLDPVTLEVTLLRLGRRARFLAVAALFELPVVGRLAHGFGFIPVRPGAGRHALDAARAVLETGELVVIYPEGHVARGRALRARPGVGRLARETGLPVVPVAQVGMERGARPLAWLRRRRAAVVLGAPFRPGGSDQEAADEVLRRIRALLPETRALADGHGRAPERLRSRAAGPPGR